MYYVPDDYILSVYINLLCIISDQYAVHFDNLYSLILGFINQWTFFRLSKNNSCYIYMH